MAAQKQLRRYPSQGSWLNLWNSFDRRLDIMLNSRSAGILLTYTVGHVISSVNCLQCGTSFNIGVIDDEFSPWAIYPGNLPDLVLFVFRLICKNSNLIFNTRQSCSIMLFEKIQNDGMDTWEKRRLSNQSLFSDQQDQEQQFFTSCYPVILICRGRPNSRIIFPETPPWTGGCWISSICRWWNGSSREKSKR